MLLLPVCRGLAQPWYLPTDGVDSVILQNTSNQLQNVWLSAPNDLLNPVDESNISIPPGQSVTLNLGPEKSWPWLQIKSYSTANVRIFGQNNSGNSFAVSSGRADTLQLKNRMTTVSGQLHLSNLSPLPQTLQIAVHTFQGSIHKEQISLAAFAKASVDMQVSPLATVVIQGQYAITGLWSTSQGTEQLEALTSQVPSSIDPQETYFLMSNAELTQSYIFHTHDSALITQARNQIQNPARSKILVAKIDYGNGNFNRDLLSPLRTVWSWQISQVYEFADLASQDCDGSPAIVEDALESWLGGTGAICFWNYKILRELSAQDLNN
jgi:hypothetical protein